MISRITVYVDIQAYIWSGVIKISFRIIKLDYAGYLTDEMTKSESVLEVTPLKSWVNLELLTQSSIHSTKVQKSISKQE